LVSSVIRKGDGVAGEVQSGKILPWWKREKFRVPAGRKEKEKKQRKSLAGVPEHQKKEFHQLSVGTHSVRGGRRRKKKTKEKKICWAEYSFSKCPKGSGFEGRL